MTGRDRTACRSRSLARLPDAPLAMPKQRLEDGRPAGSSAGWPRVWAGALVLVGAPAQREVDRGGADRGGARAGA